jgi:hypothetical protein
VRNSFATRFAVASLAAWRVTHLLAEEDGPGHVVLRLRRRAGTSEFGSLMDCFGCLSFWVAAPLSPLVAPRRRDVPLVWLALSGAACLLERATDVRVAVSPFTSSPQAHEDPARDAQSRW